MDITQLILDDHHEQRRLFAMIDDVARTDVASLDAIWKRLSTFLEVHAASEEAIFYPAVLRVGMGAGGRASVEAETEDAIEDHNEIRDSVKAVAKFAVGSAEWFAAVDAANKANSEHMGEEEREALTDFRRHAPLPERHALGIRFAAYEMAHVTGLDAHDSDPKAYVADNRRG